MAKRFYKSGILLTLVGLTMRSVAMLFSSYISRTVGAEGVGIYTLIMTVYSFAVTFATSGISLTVTRLVASVIGEGRPDRAFSVLRAAFIYAFGFGFLASLVLFFGADFLGNGILADQGTVIPLRVLSISLLPISLGSVLTGYFVGVKRVAFNATASIFCQLVKILMTVLLIGYLSIYGTEASVIGLCIGVTVTEMLGFLIIFFEFLYDLRKNFVKAGEVGFDIKAVFGTALPLAFSAYVRSFLLNVEHILIPKKLREGGENSAEAYAHYGILHGMALPLITFPMSPLSSFAGLLVPEFAEDLAGGKNERINRVASKALNTTLAYAVISAVFLYSFAEELGYTLFRSYDAGYYISVLALVVPIMYLDHVTDSILKGIGEQVFSMWVNISDSLLSVILVSLLIPRMGIMGYAVVIIIMEGFNFALSFYRLRKNIKFKLNFVPFMLIPLAVSFIAARISQNIFNFGGSCSSPLWLALKIVFALCFVVFFLTIFNEISRKNKLKSKTA